MHTLDRRIVAAAPAVVWPLACDVGAWPELLPHYRWVRHLEGGVVEMAAWRPFGRLRWPTWWRSTMRIDPAPREIHYRHVAGITRGMTVRWQILPHPEGSDVRIDHWWDGPSWPLIGGVAAALVIGPVFVHGIASRTLAGLARAAEG